MNQESEEARRITATVLPNGKDEMNLAEFPIALLTDRVPKGVITIESQDEFFDERAGKVIVRKRVITGSDKYGLPTAKDDEVILGLIQLTRKANNFAERTVNFSRSELIELLHWPHKGQSFKRLALSFDRWASVYLSYEKAWYDNVRKSWIDEKFHILDYISIYDWEEQRQQPQVKLSSFTWNEVIFRSFQAGYLKSIDLDFYFSLRSATAKRLYRFLDKRFYLKRRWEFGLQDFSYNHMGFSKSGYEGNGHLAKKLRPAIEELEARGFLESLTEGTRFERRSRKEWRVLFLRGKEGTSGLTSSEPEPLAEPNQRLTREPEATPIEQELVSRGVTLSTARELARDYPEERIAAQVEQFDWLSEKSPGKVHNPGGYLADSIRENYVPPKGFATKAKREALADEKRRHQEEVRKKKAEQQRERHLDEEARKTWDVLSEGEKRQLEAQALSEASPELRSQYELAKGPPRRLLLVGIRQSYLRGQVEAAEARENSR